MTSGRLSFVLAALVASAAALTEGRAAPLDAETCAKHQIEHTELERAGVEKDMEKGPDWAKANLGLEKMQRVQRFIELEEVLLFRCRSRTIVHLTPEREWSTDQDSDDKDDNDDDKEATKGGKAGAAPAKADPTKADPKQKPPAAKPAATPKKPPPKTAPAKSAAEQPAESGVTSIEKRPPPKAKVDDAYKVPPVDPSVNPFANQLNLPMR
jgi:hypothetical protein